MVLADLGNCPPGYFVVKDQATVELAGLLFAMGFKDLIREISGNYGRDRGIAAVDADGNVVCEASLRWSRRWSLASADG